MLRRILLPSILLVLSLAIWISADFRVISAGVALFLFGMLSLEEGFKAFTGGDLERLLARVTSNRWKSLGFGLLGSALMQTSSLVSVIAISFLSAGLISLTAGIGIVFGANLGTTTGAWLIAGFGLKVDIAAWAMPLLVFGVVLLLQSSRRLKGIGYVLSGLGFLFLGIFYMKEGFVAYQETIDLSRYAVGGYRGVLTFAALGLLATVVMQSSHATLVLTITALAAQQITYENALALAIGANLGTTVTAIIGSLSANENGRRLAVAHLVFNLVTALVAIVSIRQLMVVVNSLAGMLSIADTDFTLKLALFHTLFNLLGVVLMLPFINALVVFLGRVIPDKPALVDQPKFLSAASAEFPDTAIEAVRNEIRRIYDAALAIICASLGIRQIRGHSVTRHELPTKDSPVAEPPNVDAMYERHVKTIYSAIIAFISDTAFSQRDDRSDSLQWLREASLHVVEAIKDAKHLQKNFRRHVRSTNPDLRKAYEEIRASIDDAIGELQAVRLEGDGVMDMLALDALNLTIDERRDRMTERATGLIGGRRISPLTGSSLLNDGAYAHAICRNLLLASRTLFGTDERAMLRAAKVVSLDDAERAEASVQKPDNGDGPLRGRA